MELVEEFKALADKTRLRIISILSCESLCVCEVMDILDMTQSRISRHLGILKQAGLIEEERKGKWVIYKIAKGNNPILSYIQEQAKKDSVYKSVYKTDMAQMKKTLKKSLCPNKNC